MEDNRYQDSNRRPAGRQGSAQGDGRRVSSNTAYRQASNTGAPRRTAQTGTTGTTRRSSQSAPNGSAHRSARNRSTVRKPQNAADNSTAGYPQAFSGRDTGHNPPYHPVPDRISFRGWSGYTQNDGERDGKVTAQYISR